MLGYTKIKLMCTKKTRLIDHFDHFSPPYQTPMSNLNQMISSQSQDTKYLQINISTINTDPHDSFLEKDHKYNDHDHDHYHDDDGKLLGVILSRNRASLSANDHGLMADIQKQESAVLVDHSAVVRKTFSMSRGTEKQNSALDSAVRRAFSMRASPSTAERYCRIDHQYNYDPAADEENLLKPRTEYFSKKRSNKIFEACKRLFGF